MSDQKSESSTSFVNAFLPGLILGLIVGAVAGAYLPDMMNKPAVEFTGEVGTSSGPRRSKLELLSSLSSDNLTVPCGFAKIFIRENERSRGQLL